MHWISSGHGGAYPTPQTLFTGAIIKTAVKVQLTLPYSYVSNNHAVHARGSDVGVNVKYLDGLAKNGTIWV